MLRSVDKEKATGPFFLTHPSTHYPWLTARHFFSHEQVASSTASFYSSHRCTVIVTTIACVATVMLAHRSKTTITLSSASDFMFPQRDQRFLASQSHTSHRMILLYRRLITLLLLHLIRGGSQCTRQRPVGVFLSVATNDRGGTRCLLPDLSSGLRL